MCLSGFPFNSTYNFLVLSLPSELLPSPRMQYTRIPYQQFAEQPRRGHVWPPRSEERAHITHLRATSFVVGFTISCRLANPPTQHPAHTHLVRVRVIVRNPDPNPNPSPRPDRGPTHLI